MRKSGRPKPAPPVGLISFGSHYQGAPLQTTPLHFAIEWPERSGTAPRGRFDDPIPLPRGRQLVTLQDAGTYITKLPKAEHTTPEWP
jgi:hypothetical protein